MLHSSRRVLVIIGLAGLLAACGAGFPEEFHAPDFTLRAPLTGERVRLSDLKGRPVVIYWFASW